MKHRMLETRDSLKLYLQIDSVENAKAVVVLYMVCAGIGGGMTM